MLIINNTAQDITFELDVNKNPMKGMQSRLTVSANSRARVDVEHVFVLVLDKGFQAQVAAGKITLRYSPKDTAYLTAFRNFLTGSL